MRLSIMPKHWTKITIREWDHPFKEWDIRFWKDDYVICSLNALDENTMRELYFKLDAWFHEQYPEER